MTNHFSQPEVSGLTKTVPKKAWVLDTFYEKAIYCIGVVFTFLIIFNLVLLFVIK